MENKETKKMLIDAFKKQLEKTTNFEMITINGNFRTDETILMGETGEHFTLSRSIINVGNFGSPDVGLRVKTDISFMSLTSELSEEEHKELKDLSEKRVEIIKNSDSNDDYVKLKKIIEG